MAKNRSKNSKNDVKYIYLMSGKFIYLDNRNSILLVLSFRNWVKTMEREMTNLFFL